MGGMLPLWLSFPCRTGRQRGVARLRGAASARQARLREAVLACQRTCSASRSAEAGGPLEVAF